MSAVVEGVEAAEQFKEFKMHCDVDRGYYLSEPLLAQSLGAPSYCNPF
jgi:EAL domain-containing protein (putative c-di-GMP-specific phosphodiesterase class I)